MATSNIVNVERNFHIFHSTRVEVIITIDEEN